MMKKRAEWILVLILTVFIQVLPVTIARWIGRRLGDLMWKVVGIRKQTVIDNLERCFPDWSQDRILDTAENTYRFYGEYSVDWLKASDFLRTNDWSIEGWKHIENHRDDGGIMMTGHIGYWEHAAILIAKRLGSITVYADEQSNPYTQRLIDNKRKQHNVTSVSGVTGLKNLVKKSKSGEFVGILADQRPRNRFKWTPFFESEVKTTRIPIFLARKTESPVFPIAMIRQASGDCVLKIDEPFQCSLGTHEDGQGIHLLEQYNQWLEEMICQYPDQYFWLHKRWQGARSLEEDGDHS